MGVALVMLSLGGTVGGGLALTGYLAVVAGAFAGAASILGIIIFFSTLVRSNVMLLIIGIMVGYLTSSLISLLNFFATDEGIRSYVLWGMGDFSSVSLGQLPVFCSMLGIGLLLAALLVKPLNALLLGERYAENLGVRVKRVRLLLLVSTGLLTAVVTAFCGPISFIGLAVPHLARLMTGSSNHKLLMPLTLLTGSGRRAGLQSGQYAARRIGRAAAERYHAGGRRSGDYLCDRESEKNPIFQLMEPTGTALGAQDLSIGYPARGRKGGRLYGALSLALRSGELTCLLGPNGAGKSTLLRTLGGLQRPLEGRVTWQGRQLERYGARERSRLLGVVLTDRSQAGGLRVRELVEMGRYPYTGFFGRLDAADPGGRRTRRSRPSA